MKHAVILHILWFFKRFATCTEGKGSSYLKFHDWMMLTTVYNRETSPTLLLCLVLFQLNIATDNPSNWKWMKPRDFFRLGIERKGRTCETNSSVGSLALTKRSISTRNNSWSLNRRRFKRLLTRPRTWGLTLNSCRRSHRNPPKNLGSKSTDSFESPPFYYWWIIS